MLKPQKYSLYPTVPRNERRLFSSSVLLSSHSATCPGERRLILQPENFSIQNTVSERSRAGRMGRSWWSWDSSTPVIVYTDKHESVILLSSLNPTADTAGMGGSSDWDLYLSLCVRFQSKQEQKEGKKGRQGKLRSQNPEEAAGCDRINLSKKVEIHQCWRSSNKPAQ